MRILLIAPEFPPSIGGMQIHAAETAVRLARRRNDVLVLTSSKKVMPPVHFPFPVEPILTRNFHAALRSIMTATRRFRPDVLLMMNAGFAPLAARHGPALPPVVVRTAGNDAYGAWYGPRLPLRFLFWRLPHNRDDSLGATLRRRDQENRVAAVISSLASCARVLCNSSYCLSRLRDHGVPAEKLHLLVGGVDTDTFRPAGPGRGAHRALGEPPVLGIAGHLLPIKGIDVAIRMLPLLSRQAGNALLRIAGTGSEEPALRTLADHLGVGQRLQFLGDLPPEAMPDFYRGLDLYLQPSVEVRHPESRIAQAETMGRALCEAQACGVPVIASRSGGIPDILLDGLTGRLVPQGDPAGLAAVVTSVLDNPAQLSTMGAEGRLFAAERFSWEAVVDTTLRHLQEVRTSQS